MKTLIKTSINNKLRNNIQRNKNIKNNAISIWNTYVGALFVSGQFRKDKLGK